MMTIIDYGCGNIKAFINAFTRLNINVEVATTNQQIMNASCIILPGVGAFDFVMDSLNRSGLRVSLERKVLEEKIPVLGVCAGMQILADSSEEGIEMGLGWIPGKVRMFDILKIPFITKIPHMGWNEIRPSDIPLFANIKAGSHFYFVHSFYFEEENPETALAKTDYGIEFTSAVGKENIYGVQFHPEKSHSNGIQLLQNFASLSNK